MTSIPGTDSIADISHWSGSVNLVQAKASSLTGLLQKATQGTDYVDPTLTTNSAGAASAGLSFGTYHFGTSDDPTTQANFYLQTVHGISGLLVLDFEENGTPQASMTVAQAETFVQVIQQATGVWPGVYCGSYARGLLGTSSSAILANCWLWYAEYGSAPTIPEPTWSTWTMWQYTDGTNVIVTTPVTGIGACDRETFNGTSDELVAFWRRNSVTP